LVEALGDEAWENLLRWHDQMLRSMFVAHQGEEVVATGDGFFVGFDTPEAALACAVAIQRGLAEHRVQHGFAPQVRIGLHATEATGTDAISCPSASRAISVPGASARSRCRSCGMLRRYRPAAPRGTSTVWPSG